MKQLFLFILGGVFTFHLKAQVSFAPATNYPVSGGPTWVAAADINNDGSVDLITANVFSNSVSVFTNDGHGGFGFSSTIGVGAGPGFVAAADVNGNGWLDLICANGGGNTLSVLTNDGHGGFMTSSTPIVGNHPYSLVVVDINGDGKPDVVSANDSDNTLSVLTNSGTGNFILAATLPVGGAPNTVITADVNRDGKPDLICANYNVPSTLSIYTNNGTGGFVLASSPSVGAEPYGCVAADVNGDGYVDLISASYAGGSGNTLSVLTNNGAGGFVLASSPQVSPAALGVIAVDLNLDGKIDLVCPNFGPQTGHTLTVFTNDGSGGFATASVPGVGTGPSCVVAADINGDGKPDLISANLFGGSISVILNTTPIRGATAVAVLTNGIVLRVDIVYGGFGYTNTPLVRFIGGGGNGAQAIAIVSNDVVAAIDIINAGSGYTNAPLVIIDPPFVPAPLLGIAPMSFLSFSNLAIGGSYQLQQRANWYWANQPVNFTAASGLYTQFISGVVSSNDFRLALTPVPAQAFATPQVVNGFIVGANVTSGGSGYITSPTVTVVGGGGSNCVAESQISGGVVTGINILDSGRGYNTGTPTLEIAAPPAAAVFPSLVQPVMRVDAANLVPYDNYQIQFKANLNAAWSNWNGGLFTPVNMTSSQFLFISNSAGFFQLQLEP